MFLQSKIGHVLHRSQFYKFWMDLATNCVAKSSSTSSRQLNCGSKIRKAVQILRGLQFVFSQRNITPDSFRTFWISEKLCEPRSFAPKKISGGLLAEQGAEKGTIRVKQVMSSLGGLDVHLDDGSNGYVT